MNTFIYSILSVSLGLFLVLVLIPYLTKLYLGYKIWKLGRKIRRDTDNEELKELAGKLEECGKEIIKKEKL